MLVDKLLAISHKILPLRFMRYHYYRVDKFIKIASLEIDNTGESILDIGAQESPFRKYFTKADYRTQDICQNLRNSVDYIGDINEGIPDIPDASFDNIVCTQVLEHLKRPHVAVGEFFRILKPGGKVFLTTHLCFEEHMVPYDYFRFTRYGLKSLGDDAGLKLNHLAPHGGIFQLLGLILATLPIKLFLRRETFAYYLYLAVFSLPIFLMNIVFSGLDYLDREKTMTLNYECVFQKPEINR